MACKVGFNKPLETLRKDLGLPLVCHSPRRICVRGLGNQETMDSKAWGIEGTVIGYCQGLFVRSGTPAEHSQNVVNYLKSIGAPWAASHELFEGNRQPDESFKEYISAAFEPLLGNGRVPVYITDFDPAIDYQTLRELFSTPIPVRNGETMLCRIVLNSAASIAPSVALIRELLVQARGTQTMPPWWPLLQGNFGFNEWNELKNQLGNDWQYTTIVVNPFTIPQVLENFAENVTIAQFLVGPVGSIQENGDVFIHSQFCAGKNLSPGNYNLFEYAKNIQQNGAIATNIICGPSLSNWNIKYNQKRLAEFMAVFEQATQTLWPHLSDETRKAILTIQATD